jgi:protein-disulfide isomerase
VTWSLRRRGAAVVLAAAAVAGTATSGAAQVVSKAVVVSPALATTRGPDSAPVTIVEFSDFGCPYCAGMSEVVRDLLAAYPGRIQHVFKHNPLGIHRNAPLAHEAALAAGEQGRFWEMHARLFSSQRNLTRERFAAIARDLGLDLSRFEAALDDRRFKTVVDRDRSEARALGVSGTPTYFINGLKLSGLQTLDAMKRAVDRALGAGEATSAGSRVRVDLEGAFARGPADAPVTLVEFSDLQCPFCAKTLPAIEAVMRAFDGQVRWVFKHYPLSFHADAPLAHRAALAAGLQGRFWEMHDAIFADQRRIRRDDLVEHAQALGLDVARFETDLDSPVLQERVERDRLEGDRLGVSGTPTFFVNGRRVLGSQTPEALERVVAAELQAALVPVPPKPGTRAPVDPEPAVPYDGPRPRLTKGADDSAPVRVIWYSDLSSRLARDARALVAKILAAYPDTVQVVFKHRPLESRPEAWLAHEGAAAAAVAGRFWEWHDLVIGRQKAWTRADLVAYAGEIGLDRTAFESALDRRTYASLVREDLAEAGRLGVLGTPVFFVNGQRVDGVQSFERLKEIIDLALARHGDISDAEESGLEQRGQR